MSEPSDGLGGIAARRRAYEREMAAPKRPSKFWGECAWWHEEETLDLLEAALAWRDSKAELNAAYVHEDEEACDAAWWAYDDAELRLLDALDALEGEREPLDGDA